MPPALIAAAVTGAAAIGASAISAKAQKKAADQAVQANNTASQQQLAEQAKARDLAYSINAPRLAGGNAAWDALLREHGLDPYAGQQAPAGVNGARPGDPGYDPSGGTRPMRGPPQPGDPDYEMYLAQTGQRGGPSDPAAEDAARFNQTKQTYNTYLANNPDLAAEAQRVVASGEFPSVEAYLQWHAQNYPQEAASRPLTPDAAPATEAAPAQPASPASPAAPSAPAAGTDLMSAARPTAGAAPTFTRPDAAAVPTYTRQDAGAAPTMTRPDAPAAPSYTRPTEAAAPTFTRPTAPAAPTFSRPDAGAAPTYQRPTDQARPDYGAAPSFSNYFDPRNLALDPSYQFRLKQGTDNVNTNFGARGLIKSGAAAKALTNYSQEAASQEYQNIFNRAMQQYGTDLGQYNTSRGFLDNEYQYGQNRTDTNNQQEYANNTNAFRYATDRQDQNFNTDRANDTNDYRYGVERTDTNFNTDRAANTSDYRYATDRADANFSEDRTFDDNRNRFDTNRIDTNFANDRADATSNYRYATDRTDNNFASDRSYGTNLALDERDRQDRLANEDYARRNDDYRYTTGRTDANFNTDRAYQTNRYDTRVANLFDIANAGQNAANGITGAQQTYANNAGNVFGAQANVAADAAAQRAQATAGIAGTAAGVASNIFNTYYANPQSAPAGGVPSDFGAVNYGNSLNPANYNYAPRVS